MYKTTKWIVATFCLAVLVFGCKVENVIQNNLTIDGFIFYATLMMSYIYNNKFYMDSLYNRNWCNPCHCCHIGHIESHMRIGSAENLTYQQVVDILYSLDQNIEIGVPLTNAQRIIIAACLVKRIQLLINSTFAA